MRSRIVTITILVALLSPLALAGGTALASANGTWAAYPGNTSFYQTSVQQPINANGTSNFKSNGKAVIPVKFALLQGTVRL